MTAKSNLAVIEPSEDDGQKYSRQVRIISGRTLHQEHQNILNHLKFKPSSNKVYLFIDPHKTNVDECNSVLKEVFLEADLGAEPFPLFGYRGASLLYLAPSELSDYPIAVISHFIVQNLDKFIAIRGARYLLERLAIRKAKGVLPAHFQSLYTVSYDPASQKCLHEPSVIQAADYELSLRRWKRVDLSHSELVGLSELRVAIKRAACLQGQENALELD